MDEASYDYSHDFEFSSKKRKLQVYYEDEQSKLLREELEDDSLLPVASTSSSQFGLTSGECLDESESDDDEVEEEEELDADVIVVHMDIREPLTKLRSLLQSKLRMDFTLYCFTLQETLPLESSKNLVDQCIQGEGIVQINIKIRDDTNPRTIDIVDVLKPADDYVEGIAEQERLPTYEQPLKERLKETKLPPGWKQDIDFLYDLIRLNIPIDPMKWEMSHVRHWLLWAVRQFSLVGVNLQDWANMPGYVLCSLLRKDFNRRVPQDPHNLFWEHCQILRIYRTVAIKSKEEAKDTEHDDRSKNEKCDDISVASDNSEYDDVLPSTEMLADTEGVKEKTPASAECSNKFVDYLRAPDVNINDSIASCSSRMNEDDCIAHASLEDILSPYDNTPAPPKSTSVSTMTNLWQFLLELLTDWQQKSSIHWIGDNGEFRIYKPDHVAKLWGDRKNKPAMNYDKLTRALRYYYDGDMITKVPGKRFVYKFVCDLKFLLGYTPLEIKERILKAEKKFKGNLSVTEDNESVGEENFSSDDS